MAQLRLFISHASPDAPFANRLAGDLRAAGADAWLDSSHMASGDFVARINNALANRDVVVLVLSPAAIQSSWVSQEFNAAIARTQQGLMRPPIVVMARPCRVADIPPLWTVYHRYDASNDYQGALHGVARELGLDTPTPALNAMGSAQRARVDRTPRSAGSRWSPSYVKTAWAAGIALACLVIYKLGDIYITAPTWYGFPLLLALVLGIGSWLVVAYQMVRQRQWIWAASLFIAVLICMLPLTRGNGVAYSEFIESYSFDEVTALLYLSAFLMPIVTLITALIGPTMARKGS